MNNNLYKEAQGYADESGRTVNVRIYTPNGHVDRDQDFNPKLSEDDKRLQKIDEKIEKLKEERAGMDNSVGSRLSRNTGRR